MNDQKVRDLELSRSLWARWGQSVGEGIKAENKSTCRPAQGTLGGSPVVEDLG